MKRIAFTFLLLLTSILYVFSQSPQAINYQAVARDADGSVLTDQLIAIQISIITDNIDGTVVYGETHEVTTNAYGAFTIQVGAGNIFTGNFTGINWGSGNKFIKVAMDKTGGTNYEELAVSQILSVPYALYAENVANKDDADANPTNELITSAILDGDTLEITDAGGTIKVNFEGFSGGSGDSHSLDAADGDPADVIYVDSLGKVGIGTTDPSYDVHIFDNNDLGAWLGVQTDSSNQWSILDLKTPNSLMQFSVLGADALGGGAIISNTANIDVQATNGLNIINEEASHIAFLTSGWQSSDEKMRITADGKVGIGTNSPEFKLSLDNDGAIIAKGTYGSGDSLTTSGAGTRFIWYPKKAAFRAGYVDGTQWDSDSIGDYSVAFGVNNKALGNKSTISGGSENAAFAHYSTIGGGYNNETSDIYATVSGGNTNAASGAQSTVSGGANNTASGHYSTVSGGLSNTAAGDYSWAGGRYMQLTDAADSTFVWGIATTAQSISTPNAFLIFPAGTAGKVGIGTTSPAEKLDINGNIKVLGNASSGNTGIDLQIAESTSGKGGKVYIKAGGAPNNYSANHWGGDVEIMAGYGQNNSGGNVTIEGGLSSIWTQSTTPTKVNIYGGSLDGNYGPSALITIEGGKQIVANSANKSAGHIFLLPGTPEGTGTSGYVGIGTTTPAEKLDVAGKLKIGAYTLPETDGTTGQVLATDGSGTLTWTANDDQTLTEVLSVSNDAGSQNITNLADPVNGQDAATKAYVDELIAQIEELQLATGIKIKDYDGNIYETITIGNQIWMVENLRTTHYADGTALVDGTGAGDITGDYTTKYYFWYNDDSASYAGTYGALYTWAAIMNDSASSDANPSGVQGVCPAGWHIPGDSEWKELEMFLGMSQADADNTGWRGTDEGGKLKETGTTHWNSPNTGATNESGFTALPAGSWDCNGTFGNLGYNTYFWSATENITSNAWYRGLYCNYSDVDRPVTSKDYGFSVRCLKD